MDPLSLTLAVIPLLVSTAEHYKATYDAFHRLRKASREAENLRVALVVQRALFDDNCRNLLGKCGVDEAMVALMLKSPRHTAWSMKELQSKIKKVLGSFSEAFVGILQQIEAELKAIEDKMHSCFSVDRGVGWRVRLAVTKPALDKSIEQINRLNINLNDIRMRIDDASRWKQSKGLQPARIRPKSRNELEIRRPFQEFAVVRQVSQKLYQALAGACNEHDRHDTLINLTPRINITSKCVQLELALRNPRQHSWTPMKEHAIWLSVESLNIINAGQTEPLLKQLEFVSVDDQPSLSIQNVVATHRATPSGQEPQRCSVQSHRKEFCRRVHGGPTNCQSRSCIGFFQHNRGAELEVFLVPKLPIGVSRLDVSTLNDLFSQKPSSNQRTLNPSECVRLGRKLATAMLNFHSTSWLSPLWSSQHIQLLHSKIPTSGNVPTEKEPYLDVAITASGPGASGRSLEASDPKVIENSFLYRLGVILLELAFEQPLRDMRINEDEMDGAAIADFYTATRTRNNVAGVLGHSYAKIVGQCLKCNFQSGVSDLHELDLQEDVYRDVVCKLGSLEQKLQGVWT
jgi:hypothetical protein